MLLKVVSHYDLSVLVSVMGFKKITRGGSVG